MIGTTSHWEDELRSWLKPFLWRFSDAGRHERFHAHGAALGPALDRVEALPGLKRRHLLATFAAVSWPRKATVGNSETRQNSLCESIS